MPRSSSIEQYVTFKWLMVQTISIIGTILFVSIFLYQAIGASLSLKVDKTVFDEVVKAGLCTDISDIKRQVQDNAIAMDKLKRNQDLVLRHLKIDPVN